MTEVTEPLASPEFEQFTLKPVEIVDMALFRGHEDVEGFAAWLTANLPEGDYVSTSYNAIWFGPAEDQRYLFNGAYLCRDVDGDIFVHDPNAHRAFFKRVIAPAPE